MPVMLFIGVKEENFKEVKLLIDQLDEDIKNNIKLFQITEQKNISKNSVEELQQPLFS
jgi:hypothetical protein